MRRTAAIALLVLLSGCFWVTTKHEGKTLRTDIDALDERLEVKESSLQTKIAELEDILAKATKLLRRNSADLGADVKALSEDNAKLTGLVKGAERAASGLRSDIALLREQYDARINGFEARLAMLEQKANRPPPKTADELFRDGKAALAAANYKEARAQFAAFVRKWPGHDKADDAMYYWADGYFLAKEYEKAVAVYQKVFEEYKSSDWADDALYKAGQAGEKLKWCTDARAYYSLLQQRYPKSSLKKKAAARIKQLKKSAKNRKKCQS